ncbi:MAG: hypothetical protein CMP07_13755 [Xanthomonadales bacterium]|nr:hypothetical protein [Xanthomonadales bacterium]|tara:strand:+ start:1272 stop:2300 length:1029 start_codon:yes stop_codon:yes gene_type:complete
MKKLILVLVLVTAVTVVLGVPAAIGLFVQKGISSTVEDRLPDARVAWDRGWFRSGVRIDDEDFNARLNFRHASPGAGWVSVDGLVNLVETAAAIDIDAKVSLGGTLTVNAKAPALDMPGPVTWQYDAPSLRVVAEQGGDTSVYGTAEGLLILDGIGNRLAFAGPVLEFKLTSESMQSASGRLSVSARRVGQAESRLVVNIDSISMPAMAELVQALHQLAGAEPDSTAAGLGAIGAASAWQQLAAAGLTVELEELVLDGQARLSGLWVPDDRNLILTGEGDRATIADWWANIAGLAQQAPPEEARSAARQGLEGLAAQGAITLGRRQVTVNIDGLPQAEAAIE